MLYCERYEQSTAITDIFRFYSWLHSTLQYVGTYLRILRKSIRKAASFQSARGTLGPLPTTTHPGASTLMRQPKKPMLDSYGIEEALLQCILGQGSMTSCYLLSRSSYVAAQFCQCRKTREDPRLTWSKYLLWDSWWRHFGSWTLNATCSNSLTDLYASSV